ncbi:MAG: diguanylate cyclase (GGDEF)-like protein [Gammaproteobacteria bacterium]|jgi:diguanylate cyclase (GGDEF)-like protein
MSFFSTTKLAISQTDAGNSLAENNRVLLAELRYNSIQNILVSGIFAVFFFHQSGSREIFVWWTVFAVVVLARSVILRWLQATNQIEETQRSLAIYACIGVTALMWGFAPLASGSAYHDLSFILAVSWVLIVVIGGVNAFDADPVATAALALPATVPSLLMLIANQDRASFAVVVAIGLTYAHVTVGNIRARRALHIELSLKAENAALLQKYETQVRLATEELERRLHNERELRAARHRAEQLSSLDGLTGIANRRYFDEQIKSELGRAFRAHKPVSVVLLDIDCFKQFNDTLGHSAGDDCLAEIGKVLSNFARRDGDTAARFGGEEFVLLLPESDHRAALGIAESLRASIVDRAIAHPASAVAGYVTASFGVATLTPTADHTPRQLIEAADKALYGAKKAGRNQVVSAKFA